MKKFEYSIGLTKRKVSLVVQLIDSYTGKAVIKNTYAEISGAVPVVKPEGYYVFTDLPDNEREIAAGGNMFFPEKINLAQAGFVRQDSCPVSRQEGPPVLKIYLTPNTRYELPAQAAYVSEQLAQGGLRFWGRPQTSCILLKEQNGKTITIDSPHKHNFTGRMMMFAENGRIGEMFIIGFKINDEKYSLESPLACQYPSRTKIYPLSLGQTDEKGYLFQPLWGIKKEGETAILYNSTDNYGKDFTVSCIKL